MMKNGGRRKKALGRRKRNTEGWADGSQLGEKERD